MSESNSRIPRHEHRVRTFSRDYALIAGYDRYVVESADVVLMVEAVVERFEIPVPDLVFSVRRRPDTGQCWAPRWHAVATNGEDSILAWEARYRRPYLAAGQIRLGTTTRLRTLAHELGHHLVHHLDPVHTPAHGKVWVGRFDDAMETIADMMSLRT